MSDNKSKLPLCVLVLEDESLLRELIVEILKELQCDVLALPSADVGYHILHKQADKFDLVISDICMPGYLDGVDLANLIMIQWPNVDVVLTSGYDRYALNKLKGKITFLQKPWTIEMLQKTLSTRLNKLINK
jgi:DNA-binding NtrC family response regulator